MIDEILAFYEQYEAGNCFQSFFGEEELPIRYMEEYPANLEDYAGCVIVVETDLDGPKRTHRKRSNVGKPWSSPRKFCRLKSIQEPVFVSYRTRVDKRYSYSRYYKVIGDRRIYLTFVKQRSEKEAAEMREKAEKRKQKRKRDVLPVAVHPQQPSVKRFRNLLMAAPHDFCYQPTLSCF